MSRKRHAPETLSAGKTMGPPFSNSSWGILSRSDNKERTDGMAVDSTSKILVTEANPWGPIGASKLIGGASTLFRDMVMAWKDDEDM